MFDATRGRDPWQWFIPEGDNELALLILQRPRLEIVVDVGENLRFTLWVVMCWNCSFDGSAMSDWKPT